MPYFVVYATNGTIQQVSRCDDEVWAVLLTMPNPFRHGALLEIEQPTMDVTLYQQTHYVLGGAVLPRGEMTPVVSTTDITADGVDMASITNLPQPCTATINGPVAQTPVEIDDGELHFTADTAGDYTIRIAAVAFIDWSIVIHAA